MYLFSKIRKNYKTAPSLEIYVSKMNQNIFMINISYIKFCETPFNTYGDMYFSKYTKNNRIAARPREQYAHKLNQCNIL